MFLLKKMQGITCSSYVYMTFVVIFQKLKDVLMKILSFLQKDLYPIPEILNPIVNVEHISPYSDCLLNGNSCIYCMPFDEKLTVDAARRTEVVSRFASQ